MMVATSNSSASFCVVYRAVVERPARPALEQYPLLTRRFGEQMSDGTSSYFTNELANLLVRLAQSPCIFGFCRPGDREEVAFSRRNVDLPLRVLQ
jgi:hypothetical protein